MTIDKDILIKLRQRDEEALRLVLLHYGSLLKSVILKHLYHLEFYLDECMDDTLLAIWDKWHYYQPKKSSFKNWICGIARYRAINILRQHQGEYAQTLVELETIEAVSDQNTPLWQLELNQLISALSSEDQQLFYELFYLGERKSTVAQHHNLSLDALYKRISRGRRKLRKERDSYET